MPAVVLLSAVSLVVIFVYNRGPTSTRSSQITRQPAKSRDSSIRPNNTPEFELISVGQVPIRNPKDRVQLHNLFIVLLVTSNRGRGRVPWPAGFECDCQP